MSIINALLTILEKPYMEKGYRLLSKELKKVGRDHEAESIELLIKNDNHPHNSQEQRENN